MPRIPFSDVTPPERRSIRDIPIPMSGRRKSVNNISIKKKVEDFDQEILQEKQVNKPTVNSPFILKQDISPAFDIKSQKNKSAYEYYYPKAGQSDNTKKSNRNKIIFGGISFLVVVAFVFFMMTIFASATIKITPKSKQLDLSLSFLAKPEKEEGSVSYEVIKLSKTKTVSVVATGEELVENKAKGKIVVYNNFSSEPQRLITRTRFETPEGLIYRIPESIVVPGKTINNGIETPGSIEVEVFADEPGDKFNIGKTDFTIPGFKNDSERYKNFYAKSSTDMSGGFVGKMKTISENEKIKNLSAIQSEIEEDLKKELSSKVPEGLTLLNNGIVFESNDLPQKEESSSVILGKEVTAYALVFDSEKLSELIKKEYLSTDNDWKDLESYAGDFSLISIKNKIDKSSIGDPIDLEIEGKIVLFAKIDQELLAEKLLGVSRKDVDQIIKGFSGIDSVVASIRPTWKTSFPQNPSKIKVLISKSGQD